MYKINLDNSADVTLISLEFTSAGYSLSGGSYGLFLDRIEDLIIGYDFQIKADDTVIQTVGSKRFEYSGTPMFRYKNFLLYWGGEYSIKKRYLALLTPYMASINNLDTAVVKTSDMRRPGSIPGRACSRSWRHPRGLDRLQAVYFFRAVCSPHFFEKIRELPEKSASREL